MTGRNRHDPNEPKEFIVEMCERVSQGALTQRTQLGASCPNPSHQKN